MPTYIAFLRAINLGARRKFPKDAIRAAVESTGATDVATYINTGNVRLTTQLRSRARVEAALEEAFLADRGFEVPTYAFTPDELVAVGATIDELWAEYGEPDSHYVMLYRDPPGPAAIEAAEHLGLDKEVVRVDGRAAHLLLLKSFHEALTLTRKEFDALGVGTARNVRVIRTLVDRWC